MQTHSIGMFCSISYLFRPVCPYVSALNTIDLNLFKFHYVWNFVWLHRSSFVIYDNVRDQKFPLDEEILLRFVNLIGDRQVGSKLITSDMVFKCSTCAYNEGVIIVLHLAI